MSTGKAARIHALVHAIVRFLDVARDEEPAVVPVLDRMRALDLSLEGVVDVEPRGTRHARVLTAAIADVTAPRLGDIAHCLDRARHDLAWREDNGRFYAPDADLGAGYRDCNLHALLVGPNACGFEAGDFCLGVFMLGPRTLYRDHVHDAPELYLNLSSRSGWRLRSGAWQDYAAGSLIWNAPNAPHAIRSYDRPFLSIFAWLENIDTGCMIVPFADWAEIERSLHRGEL